MSQTIDSDTTRDHNNETGASIRQRIWDIPVRVFHFLILILVAVSIYTGETGGFEEMDYHMLAGYCIAALVLFRIIWGVVGTYHARFSSFIRPGLIPAYLKHLIKPGGNDPQMLPAGGHNPLGALSVVALLLCLMIQVGTGLFANDDIFLEGPLTHLVTDERSDQLTTIHHWNIKVLYGLVALHLIAIVFYEFKRGERLILAMLHGNKSGTRGPHVAFAPVREIIMALAIMIAAAGAIYWLVNYV